VKIYEERGNLLTVVKRSKNQLYEIQLEVVCASVEDTDAHLGQQKAVASDKMALVEPEVTPVGSSSVATPSMATKVLEEVYVSMPNSEELEVQPECIRTTDVASCDILDEEVVPLPNDCSNDKKTDGQHAVVPIVLTTIMNSQEIASDATFAWGVAQGGFAWQPGDPYGVVDMWKVSTNLGPQLGNHARGLDGPELGGSISRLHVGSSRVNALDTSTRRYFVERKLTKCKTTTTSMMLCPETAESTGRPPTPVHLRRLLDLYRENVLPDKNLMKTKRICELS
jgi:hypothetical protein